MIKHTFLLSSSLLLNLFIDAYSLKRQSINLAGEWKVKLDLNYELAKNNDFLKPFDNSINLPGTLEEAGYGNPQGDEHAWNG